MASHPSRERWCAFFRSPGPPFLDRPVGDARTPGNGVVDWDAVRDPDADVDILLQANYQGGSGPVQNGPLAGATSFQAFVGGVGIGVGIGERHRHVRQERSEERTAQPHHHHHH